MSKVVKRTYKRKNGQVVTKIYEYKHKSTKGKTLVNKKGVINRKNVKAEINKINNNPNYDEDEKMAARAELEALVNNRHKYPTGKALTTTGVVGKTANDSITRMFANAGYDVDDIADEYGIDPYELIDPTNWHGSVFKAGGKRFRFTFTYTGSAMEEF